MDQAALQRIRQAVIDNRHRLTFHAEQELAMDHLIVVDAESALLTGDIARIEPDAPDQPGPRYTVIGTATDQLTKVGIVCRFEIENRLLIITCYHIDP